MRMYPSCGLRKRFLGRCVVLTASVARRTKITRGHALPVSEYFEQSIPDHTPEHHHGQARPRRTFKPSSNTGLFFTSGLATTVVANQEFLIALWAVQTALAHGKTPGCRCACTQTAADEAVSSVGMGRLRRSSITCVSRSTRSSLLIDRLGAFGWPCVACQLGLTANCWGLPQSYTQPSKAHGKYYAVFRGMKGFKAFSTSKI